MVLCVLLYYVSHLINSYVTHCIHIYRSKSLYSWQNVEVVELKTNDFKYKLFIGCLHPIWNKPNSVTYIQYTMALLYRSMAGSGPMNGKLADRYCYPSSLFTILFPINPWWPGARWLKYILFFVLLERIFKVPYTVKIAHVVFSNQLHRFLQYVSLTCLFILFIFMVCWKNIYEYKNVFQLLEIVH